MPTLEEAARVIADQYPIEEAGLGQILLCRHCGRSVEAYITQPWFKYTDRRAHEPDCSWIALREALGMEVS